ncbi:MAG: XAC2610-related protein [Bryobacteraceae bacterium]
MWRLLSVVALCAMPALRADVCDSLPTSPPKEATLYGSNAPLSFKLSVKSGGPAFRITVRPLWQIKGERVIIDEARAGEIEVARCEDGKQLQVLAIAADQPLNFGSAFHARDINFDGYLDFSFICGFAASGGRGCYWVYDPGSQLFVQNELTHELTDWWGSIEVDPTKHEITRRFPVTAMSGCPNTSEGEEERYRVNNNRLLLVHKQDFERGPPFCTVTEWDRIGGTMRVTKVRRFDMPPPPPPPPQSPADQPPSSQEQILSVSGDLLLEHPLDDHQEGVFSNKGDHHQIGASEFVLPSAAEITGIRWYGYGGCLISPPGTPPTFSISFLADRNGSPASEAIYTQQVQAHVYETAAHAIGSDSRRLPDEKVYMYTIDSLPPFSIPAAAACGSLFLKRHHPANGSGTAATPRTPGPVRLPSARVADLPSGYPWKKSWHTRFMAIRRNLRS